MATLPSNLTTASAAMVSGAANVPGVMVVAVVAPGVGKRLRLWTVTITPSNTAQAPLRAIYQLLRGGGVEFTAEYARAGFGGVEFTWPGGFYLPDNQNAGARVTSDLAALAATVRYGYTVEATA